MKFPKHRANLYLVERWTYDREVVIVGGFDNVVSADEFRDACRQEWIDKTGSDEGVVFNTVMTTFYVQ